jgi:hypothetical protein
MTACPKAVEHLIRSMFCMALLTLLGPAAHGGTSDEGPPPTGAYGFGRLSRPPATVSCYDPVEIEFKPDVPTPGVNPFVHVSFSAEFVRKGGKAVAVEGYCDSADGTVYRARFMPVEPGEYTWRIIWSVAEKKADGSFGKPNPLGPSAMGKPFTVVDNKRPGILRVDPKYPWHFIWEGTGDHYYLNGETAYFLLGWEDENVIHECLDRLAAAKVNRVRVLLYGRSDHTWTEPIKPTKDFKMWLNPWVAARPDDVKNPGFDFTRFNVEYWRKVERMVRYARDWGMAVSLVMDWNDTPVHPGAGSEDERRYYRYAVARLAGFSNVCWDLGDDLDSFRDEKWTHETGMFLHQIDPYKHLATSHPVNNDHQDRTSEWFTNTSFQEWRRPIHAWMLDQRRKQAATKRIIPQVNEEYGYEDHYPEWAPFKAPAANADGNRRAAWEIAMAGCYQTTGETAKRGTGVPPDTGGGWINGRGDDTMTLLKLQAHMVTFFTSFEWWKTEPHDELVADKGAFCLAEPGRIYVVYLPHGGRATVMLEAGRYEAKWFNARSGAWSPGEQAEGPKWTSPPAADDGDWAILLQKVEPKP